MSEELPQENSSNNIQLVVDEFKNKPEFKDIPESAILEILNKGIEIVELQQYSYEGALPHPSILEGYENFNPGTTKQLIDSFIAESSHRRDIEKEMVSCETKNTSRGMHYALLVVITTIIGACVCAYFDSPVIGSIIGVGGIATLAYNFIQGRRKSS
jgi:uncharacterized membrane protein